MEDTTFEDVLERDESKSIDENNIYTLLIEIYQSIHHLNQTIMRIIFDLKVNQYNLRCNYPLKLHATNTCRYGTQTLCFKGSPFWNKIPSKYKTYILCS